MVSVIDFCDLIVGLTLANHLFSVVNSTTIFLINRFVIVCSQSSMAIHCITSSNDTIFAVMNTASSFLTWHPPCCSLLRVSIANQFIVMFGCFSPSLPPSWTLLYNCTVAAMLLQFINEHLLFWLIVMCLFLIPYPFTKLYCHKHQHIYIVVYPPVIANCAILFPV